MDITPALSGLPPDFMTQDDGPLVVRTIVALAVVAVLTVAVRFAVRWRSVVGLGMDDWLILAAQVKKLDVDRARAGLENFVLTYTPSQFFAPTSPWAFSVSQ